MIINNCNLLIIILLNIIFSDTQSDDNTDDVLNEMCINSNKTLKTKENIIGKLKSITINYK